MSRLKQVKAFIKQPTEDKGEKPDFDWLIWVVLLVAMIFIMALAIKKI